MIETEILEIHFGASDRGERLNDIVDQFRRGREVNELLALLDSSNAELVSIGAWILGELPEELYRSNEITSRLHSLTDHVDPAVRFHALGAIFPFLSPNDARTEKLVKMMVGDSNAGVRQAAEMAASRLRIDVASSRR